MPTWCFRRVKERKMWNETMNISSIWPIYSLVTSFLFLCLPRNQTWLRINYRIIILLIIVIITDVIKRDRILFSICGLGWRFIRSFSTTYSLSWRWWCLLNHRIRTIYNRIIEFVQSSFNGKKLTHAHRYLCQSVSCHHQLTS